MFLHIARHKKYVGHPRTYNYIEQHHEKNISDNRSSDNNSSTLYGDC
jgi:hypothetical protein